MAEILELADKDFETATMSMFPKIKREMDKTTETMKLKFNKELEICIIRVDQGSRTTMTGIGYRYRT